MVNDNPRNRNNYAWKQTTMTTFVSKYWLEAVSFDYVEWDKVKSNLIAWQYRDPWSLSDWLFVGYNLMISRSKKKSTNQENYARGFLWSCEARKDICCFLCHVLLVLCNEYADENTCSLRSVSWGAMLNMKHVAEPWTGPGPFEISWPILCIVTLNQCQHVPPFHTTVSI